MPMESKSNATYSSLVPFMEIGYILKLSNNGNNPNIHLIYSFGGLKMLIKGEQESTNYISLFTQDSHQTLI